MKNLTRRKFLSTSLAAGATVAAVGRSVETFAANEEIALGYISCGGRAMQLMSYFDKVPGVHVAGLCDPDEGRLRSAQARYPKAKAWKDLRQLIDDDRIDAVVIATCNHWHCLAAIWAMEAGKDVYVEKPLSHSEWEGRQTVAAARKYKRVCQVGTQQRSDPMQAAIKKFLHEDKALGEIVSARVNRYGVRGPIGKRTSPLSISGVDYDLWLGPAQHEPIHRDKLQYDWHWDWNTGSGEMGNWGVHVLDDVRNNVFLDKVTLPKRILGGGGRISWDDAGNTPNVHFAWFDTGSIPVVIGLSNLRDKPGGKSSPSHPGPGSGYIAYCEGGRLEGQRGRAVAFDQAGKVVKEFRGNNGDVRHQQNFIDAVRAGDSGLLNAEVAIGHASTGWCNMANIAFRAGGAFTNAAAQRSGDEFAEWNKLVDAMRGHIAAHGVSMESDAIRLSEVLEIDPKAEQFTGSNAASANPFLKREYRSGFEVPAIV